MHAYKMKYNKFNLAISENLQEPIVMLMTNRERFSPYSSLLIFYQKLYPYNLSTSKIFD
jgi:hypothetical protein